MIIYEMFPDDTFQGYTETKIKVQDGFPGNNPDSDRGHSIFLVITNSSAAISIGLPLEVAKEIAASITKRVEAIENL